MTEDKDNNTQSTYLPPLDKQISHRTTPSEINFLDDILKDGLVNEKGHRSVGGLRLKGREAKLYADEELKRSNENDTKHTCFTR